MTSLTPRELERRNKSSREQRVHNCRRVFVRILLDLAVKYNSKRSPTDIAKAASHVRDDEFNVTLSKSCDDILGGKCLPCQL